MIYGENAYEDAAAREDARLDAQNEAWAEDMAMMAADRELDLSPLDSEYPTEASV